MACPDGLLRRVPRTAGRRPVALAVVLLGAAVVSCRDEGASDHVDGGVQNPCGSGLKPNGPACEPIFDSCAEDELPMLGGGCRTVGFSGSCPQGWQKVSAGWCEPVIPTADCPRGTIEVLGQEDCQPLADCGNAPWGTVAVEGGAIFVDQAYAGVADGSQTRPYPRINDALAAAPAGAHIVIAAGEYQETLTLRKRVVLQGRCARMVGIRQTGGTTTATVDILADDTIIRDLSITGKRSAVRANGRRATLERVIVEDCGGEGMVFFNGAKVVVRGSVISGSRSLGIDVAGADLTLESSVVKNTRPNEALLFGYGVQVSRSLPSGSGAGSLTLRRSLVDRNVTVGLTVAGSLLVMEQSVVRNTASGANGKGGAGIEAVHETEPSKLTLRESLVAANRERGISLADSGAVLERTVVRDTQPQATPGTAADDIYAGGIMTEGTAAPAELSLRDSVVSGNQQFGIFVRNARLTVERSLIRRTRARVTDGKRGVGLHLVGNGLPATAVLTESVLAANRCISVSSFAAAVAAQVTLERSAVRDTGDCSEQEHGGAVMMLSGGAKTSFTLRESIVENQPSLGVALFGADGLIERSVIRATRSRDRSDEPGVGVAAVWREGPVSIDLRRTLVERSDGAGVSLDRAKASIVESVVRDTRASASGGFGDGIQAFGCQHEAQACSDGEETTLSLAQSVVETSERAGLLCVASGGRIGSSVFRKGLFAVDLEVGADPVIGDDLIFEDNAENRVTSGQGLTCAEPAAVPNL